MPLMKLETTASVPSGKRADITRRLSKIMAEVTRKPEEYCMVIVSEAITGCMGGKEMPVAYVDIRGIGGLTPDVNMELSRQVADMLCRELDLPQEGVYLTFTDVPRTNWGWKGRTFA